jgi:hypothetical protein
MTRMSTTAVILLVFEILAGLVALAGAGLIWGYPWALVVGGVVAIAAVELQSSPGPKDDPEEDRRIKKLIDDAVSRGVNPFESPEVPMNTKWLGYAQLVARKL